MVFVLDKNRKPLDPCRESRARKLLDKGRAAVFRMYPFTIILKDRTVEESVVHDHRIKIDPGSKTTGLAVVRETDGQVVFAAEIQHRGQKIKAAMESRCSLRRGRRNRHTRYRQSRFLNRTRKPGWLPPSLLSRVANLETWAARLRRYCPVSAISLELVRFDTQAMENPEINGVEYQRGTLAGYNAREYLLEKWGRACAYCGQRDIPLQVEHIEPKSKGGTDRISNLTLACAPCNQRKGNRTVQDFLKRKPEVLRRMLAQARTPLKDAAAVNVTRWELYQRLQNTGLPVECGSGGRTKFNRMRFDLPKEHWIDAACVGVTERIKTCGVKPLIVQCRGQGGRQKAVVNKFGYPQQYRPLRPILGWRTGDFARFDSRIVRVTPRVTGSFALRAAWLPKPISRSVRWLERVFCADGYDYVV